MIVLDTHALAWWVQGGAKLSPKARKVIAAARWKGVLHASAISLVELAAIPGDPADRIIVATA